MTPLTAEALEALTKLREKAAIALPVRVSLDTGMDYEFTGYARVIHADNTISDYMTSEEAAYVAALLNQAPQLLADAHALRTIREMQPRMEQLKHICTQAQGLTPAHPLCPCLPCSLRRDLLTALAPREEQADTRAEARAAQGR